MPLHIIYLTSCHVLLQHGCLISALLFIIAAESLAQKLNEKLEKHINIKIAQYAILFSNNFKDVLLPIEVLNKCESIAGLKLNISKTESVYFTGAGAVVKTCFFPAHS